MFVFLISVNFFVLKFRIQFLYLRETDVIFFITFILYKFEYKGAAGNDKPEREKM